MLLQLPFMIQGQKMVRITSAFSVNTSRISEAKIKLNQKRKKEIEKRQLKNEEMASNVDCFPM